MNTNTYVAGSNDKDIVLERDQQLAKLLEDDEVLCAHVYDDNGYSEFLFHGSPENIANFIGARPMVHQIVLSYGRLAILSTAARTRCCWKRSRRC